MRMNIVIPVLILCSIIAIAILILVKYKIEFYKVTPILGLIFFIVFLYIFILKISKDNDN